MPALEDEKGQRVDAVGEGVGSDTWHGFHNAVVGRMNVLKNDWIDRSNPAHQCGSGGVAAEVKIGGTFHGGFVFGIFRGGVGGDHLAHLGVDGSPSHRVKPTLLRSKPESAVGVVLLGG